MRPIFSKRFTSLFGDFSCFHQDLRCSHCSDLIPRSKAWRKAWHFSDSWHFFSKHSLVSSVLAFVVVCFCHVDVTRCVMFLRSVMEVSCLPAQYFSGLVDIPWHMTDLCKSNIEKQNTLFCFWSCIYRLSQKCHLSSTLWIRPNSSCFQSLSTTNPCDSCKEIAS